MKQSATPEGVQLQHERLAIAIMESATLEQAAAACGLSRTTAWRRLRDPQFLACLRAVRERSASHALARLHRLAGKSLAVIEATLDDATQPSARLAAALRVLDTVLKLIELDGLEGRIARIEEQQAAASEAQS